MHCASTQNNSNWYVWDRAEPEVVSATAFRPKTALTVVGWMNQNDKMLYRITVEAQLSFCKRANFSDTISGSAWLQTYRLMLCFRIVWSEKKGLLQGMFAFSN